NSILRAEGQTLFSMLAMVSGGILNLFIDPLLIFNFGLGIAGAAIATMLSQMTSFTIMAVIFLRDRSIVRLRPYFIARRAKDYLHMPECLTVTHNVEMDPEERKLYDSMKEDLLVDFDGDTLTADNAAALSNKLLQMANGAVYNSDKEVKPLHEKKLEALFDLIEQANGQSVLVCYWYKHDHQRIQEYLTAKGVPTRDLKSDQDIADWNAGKIPVALISPASAGHGLNIQKGGHILIWFSLIWSLEMYQQCNARLWRQGQNEVVTIHHIVMKDTVDENVLSALKRKDTTQQSLIDAVKAHLTI
ncbi:MAG: polysaccharide biosynthesis C-terminal domain-containing protein, partial [Clostridia bacterium]|nr:polysaccharide biosynthesis C-terminal domain-containing protein [Clostridia bacterium]